MAALSDHDLIRTYRETVRGLFAAVCRQAGGDRALAEDIVQETYLRALRAWRASGLPKNPAAWLRTVARNLLMSHYRRSGREVSMNLDETVDADDPPKAWSREDETVAKVALRRGLDALEGERAGLLHGFHVEGQTVGEIAAARRLSERAVEGRLRRARKALASALSKTRR